MPWLLEKQQKNNHGIPVYQQAGHQSDIKVAAMLDIFRYGAKIKPLP